MATDVYPCEACGWAAAFCSMLAFGTFGVPIKSKAAQEVDIDPLVFQSYKTFMCFATSWLILVAGEEFEFSPWGIVSGLFWVPGGVATIYAVKAAGLAIGIGIGSSFIVLVSFIWGIFVFGERVHSRLGACVAIFCMMAGLVGMSYFSSPESIQHQAVAMEDELSEHTDDPVQIERRRSVIEYQGLDAQDDEQDGEDGRRAMPALKLSQGTQPTALDVSDIGSDIDSVTEPSPPTLVAAEVEHVVLCGVKMTKRHAGMLSAAFCGLYGGSIMAPMKWSPPSAKGTHFLMSFSIGASIVTLSIWLLRYVYYCYRYQSALVAYAKIPPFHVRKLWLQGGLCGLLWSIGNFFSLISVFYLGEGVGYPLVQTSILVSGLWGIFYFKEVTGTDRITKWLASSLLTIFGILLLSYEHHEK